jgi:hypothetical protein
LHDRRIEFRILYRRCRGIYPQLGARFESSHPFISRVTPRRNHRADL